jgi:hypothetical protein
MVVMKISVSWNIILCSVAKVNLPDSFPCLKLANAFSDVLQHRPWLYRRLRTPLERLQACLNFADIVLDVLQNCR